MLQGFAFLTEFPSTDFADLRRQKICENLRNLRIENVVATLPRCVLSVYLLSNISACSVFVLPLSLAHRIISGQLCTSASPTRSLMVVAISRLRVLMSPREHGSLESPGLQRFGGHLRQRH